VLWMSYVLRLTSLDLSTEARYARVWNGFLSFCAARVLSALPAVVATAATYVAHLGDKGSV
jgi:branched-subunit amino acid transport protein